jgi:hypothetical protein
MQAGKCYIGSFGDLWLMPAVVFKDSSMTAIGISGTKDGFIIGADGRKTVDDISKSSDPDKAKVLEGRESQKIFPLRGANKNVAYALAGSVANPDLAFDAIQECMKLTDLFRDRDYKNETKFVNGFSKALTERINQAKHFPEFEKNSNDHWKIMDAVFGGYFKAIPFLTCVEFYHSLHFAEFHAQSMSFAGILYGSDVIRRAMYDDFGNIISGSPFTEYIQNPREINSLNDSEKYVKGYIQACSSELAISMDESCCKKIGGHIHIAELTPNEFRWRIAPISQAPSLISSCPS